MKRLNTQTWFHTLWCHFGLTSFVLFLFNDVNLTHLFCLILIPLISFIAPSSSHPVHHTFLFWSYFIHYTKLISLYFPYLILSHFLHQAHLIVSSLFDFISFITLSSSHPVHYTLLIWFYLIHWNKLISSRSSYFPHLILSHLLHKLISSHLS